VSSTARTSSSRRAASVAGVALAVGLAWPASGAPGDDAHRAALALTNIGPRPAAGRGERRAHAYVARSFQKAGLRVTTQRFRVPGRGRSRNVIGVYDTPRRCLRIVMAHADSVNGPGANDNASGVGVVVALAPRLARLHPWCDLWLVATGAEERPYTGSPDHLGALALARRVRSEGLRKRLRWALSVDTVGRGRRFWLRSPVSRARRRVERELLSAARRARVSVRWLRDSGSGNSDHRELQQRGMRAAVIEVAGGDRCHHEPCDRAGRLSRVSLARALRVVERALRIR
jgi:aminopeptidase YwaD